MLFLIDKFSVGDAFIHELSMAVNGMPKSYLTKQCQDKLNSTCLVKPTPGAEPGAQVSFKESLINKLRLLVSTWCVCVYFCDTSQIYINVSMAFRYGQSLAG